MTILSIVLFVFMIFSLGACVGFAIRASLEWKNLAWESDSIADKFYSRALVCCGLFIFWGSMFVWSVF